MPDVLDLPIRALFADLAHAPGAVVPGIGREPAALAAPPAAGPGGVDPFTPPAALAAPAAERPGEGPPEATGLVREAVLALVVREVAHLLRVLPLERAADILRDRSPGAAAASLLAEAAVAPHGEAPSALTAALVRGSQRKRALLEQAGGALSATVLAAHLGVSRQAVEKRRQTNTLLGVRLPGGEWVYPAAQFDRDGAPLDGLPDALAALGTLSPWMKLDHLLAPDPALGRAAPRSALDALREDGRAALPAVVAALAQAGGLDA